MRASLLFLATVSVASAPGCFCGNACLDVFSNVAIEGLILGVEEPAQGIDLAAAAGATAFLAEATSLSDFESNLLDDADRVWVETETTTAVNLDAIGNGLYEVTSDSAPSFAYTVGAAYTIQVQDGGETFSVSGSAPPPPTLSGIPALGAHRAGTALSFDLSGQSYDNYLAVVADDAGNITYDNRPDTASDYIDWIGGGDVGSVDIPGSAFPSTGTAYVLGVAGIRKGEDFDGFNPLVSNLAIGSLAVEAVTTAP